MAYGRDRAYEFGPFLLNAAERVLMCQGQRVPLPPKVFEMLLVLVEHAGHIVQKETLFKRVWPDTIVQEDSLTFNISTLRKALGSHANGQQFIHTEPKLGYRFVAPVKILASGSAEEALAQSPRPNGIGASSGAATAILNGREMVRDEGFSVRRLVKWAAVGLALLIVVTATVWLATPQPEPKILNYDRITADGREKLFGLATDGARVYFIEQASTGWVIAQVSASGGEPVPIASIPRDSLITDISPDRRDLLVVEGGEFAPGTLEVVPLLGGEPRRLGNLRVYSASWSPDARTLAYTTDGGVYLCDPDGSNSRRIVTMAGQLIRVRWSPNGSKLCFSRSELSGYSLWEVDRDGKGLIRLSPGFLPGLEGNYGLWTPNGEYLIGQSLCAGHELPSAVRLSSGLFHQHWGQPACLGSGPLDLDVSAISPDGARLFGFGSGAIHPQMEEYDNQDREFKPFLPNLPAEYADFSRDGQRIAYVTGEEGMTGVQNLWTSQIDASHKVQITRPPLRAGLPRWSPDGRWIAFMGKDPGQPWRVRVVSVDGGSYAPVTGVNDEEGAPTWSPDGGQVAFGGITQPAERTAGRLVIHILNLKTHQLSEVPGSEGLWTARWSPDGRYIAALTQDSRSLMLFDFRTTRWLKLATLPRIPDLVWSRHEEAIYFTAGTTGGNPAIYRMKVPKGQLERLASLKGRTYWHWLGLTPYDSPLIANYVGVREIYAQTVNWP
jgi:DNA-binding winged helix-turn-helix (wHTH) protein/Tol biopolymer transport system component